METLHLISGKSNPFTAVYVENLLRFFYFLWTPAQMSYINRKLVLWSFMKIDIACPQSSKGTWDI